MPRCSTSLNDTSRKSGGNWRAEVLDQILFAAQIALAWYAVLSMLAALIFVTSRPCIRRALQTERRATRLLVLRFLPSVFALGTVGGLVVPAFVWLEPYRSVAAGERLGGTTLALAAAGAIVLMWSATRGAISVFVNRRRMSALLRDAERNRVHGATVHVGDSPVLDGLVRPRLFASKSVLEGLTEEEFDCAVAHELAHHRAHDNLKRRLLAFAPDLIGSTSTARELESAWKRSAEVEADAAAAGNEVQAVALASALIKVARLAAGKPQVDLGRAAFHDGAPVADRVRALCTREAPATPSMPSIRIPVRLAVVGLFAASVTNAAPILAAIHRVTELIVHLP
jgi:Zn-dependent protease with chaperone function